MAGLLIGYARVSAEEQDLTAQRNGLAELGVEIERIYVDHGLTGTNRDHPAPELTVARHRWANTEINNDRPPATAVDHGPPQSPSAACKRTRCRAIPSP